MKVFCFSVMNLKIKGHPTTGIPFSLYKVFITLEYLRITRCERVLRTVYILYFTARKYDTVIPDHLQKSDGFNKRKKRVEECNLLCA